MGSKSSLMLQDDEIKQISEETGFTAQQIEKLYVRFTHLDRSHSGSLSKADLVSIPELAINPLCERLIEIFFADSHSSQRQCNDGDRINFRQFVRVLAAVCANSSASSSSSTNNSARRKQRSRLNSISSAGDLGQASQRRRVSQRAPLEGGHSSQLESAQTKAHQTNGVSEQLLAKLLFVFKIYDADGDGRISFADLRAILKLMVGDYIEQVQLDKIATRAFLEVDRDHDGFIEFNEFCNVFAGKDMDLFQLSI